jgi:hypothetical protein
VGVNVAVIVALPSFPNVIWLPAIVATSVLEDVYENVPGADDVGAVSVCD